MVISEINQEKSLGKTICTPGRGREFTQRDFGFGGQVHVFGTTFFHLCVTTWQELVAGAELFERQAGMHFRPVFDMTNLLLFGWRSKTTCKGVILIHQKMPAARFQMFAWHLHILYLKVSAIVVPWHLAPWAKVVAHWQSTEGLSCVPCILCQVKVLQRKRM